MKPQLKIEAERIEIVPFTRKYLTKKYLNWLNDKEIVKYSDQRFKKHTIKNCTEYMESFKGTSNAFWAILYNDLHIGNITTYKDVHHNVVDISIMIGDKRVWNKGFGFEAWMTMCDYLFKKEKVRKITAGTLSENRSMLSIMKKAEMIEDGIRKSQCLFDGNEVDVVHCALFNPYI